MMQACNDLLSFVIQAKLVPVPDQAGDDETGSRNPGLFLVHGGPDLLSSYLLWDKWDIACDNTIGLAFA